MIKHFLHIVFWGHFALVLLLSCKPQQHQHENKTIYIPLTDKKILSVNDIFKEIKYIPLETNNFSLLTSITSQNFSKLILKDGYIYTQELDRPLFIFDENGRWIRTIERRGQGPEEYLNFSSFDVNNNREIAVVDGMRKKILFYSWEGEFLAISSYHGDQQTPRSVTYFNDSLLIIHTPPGHSNGYKFHILNRNTLDFVRSYWPTYSRQYFVSRASNPVVDYQGKQIFHEPQNPCIYELTADSAILRYSIDVGGKMPPENFWDIKDMSWNEIVETNIWAHQTQEHKEKGYIDHIMFFSEAPETILLQFSGSKDVFDGTFALINKESRSSILIDKIAFDSHFVWKPSKMFSRFDGIVIIPIPVHILLESGEGEIRKMFPNLLEDDNPILCIAKLR